MPISEGRRRSRGFYAPSPRANAILDAWAKGETSGQIAKAYQMLDTSVRVLIQRHRRKKDPRAVVRARCWRQP